MNFHKKKHFVIFFILGLVLMLVSFISYNYGKKCCNKQSY